jgi:hypothetical protein
VFHSQDCCSRVAPGHVHLHLDGWCGLAWGGVKLQREFCSPSQVFPSLNPARREDVVLLQSWLKDTMAQLTAEFGNKGAATVQVAI